MPLEWTTLAQKDLVAIHAHIAHTDARAAFRVVHTIHRVARVQLTTAPLSGRPGRILHTRELVISQLPYIVAYRVHDGTVQVLRVLTPLSGGRTPSIHEMVVSFNYSARHAPVVPETPARE